MKGQSATEFFLYITLFMFIAIVAFVMVDYTQRSELPSQKNKVAVGVGYNIADAISLAVRAGPGFTYYYYFPKTIYGYPYNITFKTNAMVMEWTNEYGSFNYYYSLPTYSYSYDGCIKNGVLSSDKCSNLLILNNTENGLVISNR
ncbi:MAG: hypothetical protein QXF35_00300 [Candidatus Bilamarchaeaceae archaeon]